MQFLNGHPNNGGSKTMLRYTFVLILALFAIACEKNDTVDVNGVLPVDVTGNITVGGNFGVWDPSQCFDGNDAECDFDKLCLVEADASTQLGYDVYRCEVACDVTLTYFKYEDGTSEIVKSYDTCQRNGDMTVFCDPDERICKPYKVVVPPPVDPVDPPATEFYSLKCCFDPSLYGKGQDFRVNFGAGPRAPSAGLNWNNLMGSDGCGVSEGFYAVGEVTKGFWTELTDGPVSDQHDNWKGSGPNGEYVPLYCVVNGTIYPVGNHAQSCGFGFYDAYNDDGTSDSCLE